MSTATLASDSAVSLPSRLPTWVPRMLVRATAAVLRRPARWPFSSGLSQGRHRVLVPTAQPDAASTPAADLSVDIAVLGTPVAETGHPQAASSSAEATQAERSAAAALPFNTLGAHSQSIGTASQALSQGVTLRQMVVDVVLVAMWAALVPGLMWLGAAAGF